MWTEVHLEVKHGFTEEVPDVQTSATEVPGVREVHCTGDEALGPVSQASETALAVQTSLEEWLTTKEEA